MSAWVSGEQFDDENTWPQNTQQCALCVGPLLRSDRYSKRSLREHAHTTFIVWTLLGNYDRYYIVGYKVRTCGGFLCVHNHVWCVCVCMLRWLGMKKCSDSLRIKVGILHEHSTFHVMVITENLWHTAQYFGVSKKKVCSLKRQMIEHVCACDKDDKNGLAVIPFSILSEYE